MTTRKEAKQSLFEQLERLHKEEHVDDLMKAGRLDELVDIAKDLDIFIFCNFFVEHKEFFLDLEEIPNGCHYELAFWINQSKAWNNERIFDDEDEYIDFLYSLEERLAQNIAEIMESRNLSDLTLEELLFGR